MAKVACLPVISLLALITGGLAFGFDNLGDEISRSVNDELKPLDNLGSRISAEVRKGLQPLYDQEGNAWGRDLNAKISANVNNNLKPLDLSNLGQQIQQSVYQGLEPVRALEINNKMKNGLGGVTIVTHSPGGRKFLIRNSHVSECVGTISENGKCLGTLEIFEVKNREDYCFFKSSYSLVNDHICIGGNSITIVNNEINCRSLTNIPALLISVDEYNKMCQDISTDVEYKYIADPNDPGHVAIPNDNKYIKCTNNQPGVCVFNEVTRFPKNQANVFRSHSTYVYTN